MQVGFKLFAEGFSPQEIVDQAVRAEAAGFDFVEVSDHYHPWLYSHGHSGFAWSILAAAAMRTERIGLATGVTCPFIRYHPAIIAQAAATTALLSDGRFTLGVGAGERLNEHVVGQGWPAVTERHEMFREALEIIRLLWEGGYQLVRGQAPATRGRAGVRPARRAAADRRGHQRPALRAIAAELGDGIFATEPKPDIVEAYAEAGGSGPKYSEVPLAWAPDEAAAAKSAHELFRFGVTGWKVMAELPNPINFEAAAEFVTEDHMRENFACGPDVARHIEVAQDFVDAGFDHLALINAGPDPEGFFGFFEDELAEPLRALTPSS